MFRKVIPFLVVLLIPVLSPAQGSREKSALKDISKHRWAQAYASLKRSLLRDTLNVPLLYVTGKYFFESQNPDFQLDSAYKYTQRAISQWHKASPKSRARWQRFPIDSASLLAQRQAIEKAAFEVARTRNQEQSYIDFLSSYPFARERQAAIELRNTAAFNDAKTKNSYMAFLAFIEKYPDAKEVPEAKNKYDELLYGFFTQDHRLTSYEEFVEMYADSPYRGAAERNIFEISTAGGTLESYLNFLQKHPLNRFANMARNIGYHLLTDDQELPEALKTDSLLSQRELSQQYIVPFLTKGKFGFMTAEGKEVVPAQFDNVPDAYICGDITEDLLVVDNRLITRDGRVLHEGDIEELDDIGAGFVIVRGKKNILLHKSKSFSKELGSGDATLTGSRMLAIRTDELWGVYALNGRSILPAQYDSISSLGEVIVLQKDGKYIPTTIAQLERLANGEEVTLSEAFDEVKQFGSAVLVRRDGLEGVLDEQLRILIKMASHSLTPTSFGALGHSSNGYTVFNQYGEESEYFETLEVKDPWVAGKTSAGWILFDPQQRIAKSVPYDSVSIVGPFAIGRKPDGIEINLHYKPSNVITLLGAGRIDFLPGRDTTSFLAVEQSKKVSVYNISGEKMFTGTFEKIQFAGGGLFIVSRKEKKGLIDSKGKTILPFEYDAIGTESNGVISLLKAMKFGLYHVVQKKLIKPGYDKNLVRVNANVYAAFKDGNYGFVGFDEKPLSKFEFSEFKDWRDSVILVKREGSWAFYDLYKKTYEISDIKNIQAIVDSDEERLFIVQQANAAGVIHNKKGIIIPLKFTDVVNVGSAEMPLYFTEKHVEEASLFVVIYYDAQGRMIRREVYEHDDYDQIFCNP